MRERPSFGMRTSGCDAKRFDDARGLGPLAAVEHLALADQRQRDMGELDEVAARTDGAVLGDDRRDAMVDEGRKLPDDRFADPGIAREERIEAADHGADHERLGEGGAGADGMAADEVELQLLQLVAADDVRGHRPEAGGHAVDDLLLDLALDQRIARPHPLQRGGGRLDADRSVMGDRVDLLRHQRRAVENETARRFLPHQLFHENPSFESRIVSSCGSGSPPTKCCSASATRGEEGRRPDGTEREEARRAAGPRPGSKRRGAEGRRPDRD